MAGRGLHCFVNAWCIASEDAGALATTAVSCSLATESHLPDFPSFSLVRFIYLQMSLSPKLCQSQDMCQSVCVFLAKSMYSVLNLPENLFSDPVSFGSRRAVQLV